MFVLSIVATQSDLDATLTLRTRLFVEEQGVPVEEEVDAYDLDTLSRGDVVNVIGRLDGEVIRRRD